MTHRVRRAGDGARPAGRLDDDGLPLFRRADSDRVDLVVTFDAAQLADACIRRGWSFSELARQAHISRPTVQAALRGQALRPSTAWKLRWALSQGLVLAISDSPSPLSI
jgi:hypothetical protein